MHDIKLIREKSDFFIKKLKDRNEIIDLKELLNFDKKNRDLIQSKEKLEQKKKEISQQKDKTQFETSKKISLEIDSLTKNQTDLKNKIENILAAFPNIALDDVPVGKDDKFNKEIKKIGSVTQFTFKP